jgi:hypothetical protein
MVCTDKSTGGPVDATVLLDGGATCGALTTTLPSSVDPVGVGGGLECVRSEATS